MTQVLDGIMETLKKDGEVSKEVWNSIQHLLEIEASKINYHDETQKQEEEWDIPVIGKGDDEYDLGIPKSPHKTDAMDAEVAQQEELPHGAMDAEVAQPEEQDEEEDDEEMDYGIV